ncbi:hypothetical protein BPNPMPFG_006859 (plasmid) [Mesorhizobium sp. AR07]|nr:hypothetical protein BPNPMPFG_006859 [Mesorhizobium sp. AR07]
MITGTGMPKDRRLFGWRRNKVPWVAALTPGAVDLMMVARSTRMLPPPHPCLTFGSGWRQHLGSRTERLRLKSLPQYRHGAFLPRQLARQGGDLRLALSGNGSEVGAIPFEECTWIRRSPPPIPSMTGYCRIRAAMRRVIWRLIMSS